MVLVRRFGALLPLAVVCASFAGLLHTYGPLTAPYTWLRPLTFIVNVLADKNIVTIMSVAYAFGRLARPGAAASLLAMLKSNAQIHPSRRQVVSVLSVCVVVLAIDAFLFPRHVLIDRFALAMVVAAGASAQPVGEAFFRKVGRGTAEAFVTATCLVLVSYTFTIVKANLFHYNGIHDDQLITAETVLFGEPLHRYAAAWGQVHPHGVMVLDNIYFKLFDHMLVVSMFLIGYGNNLLRHRYLASLCICYLVGGLAYYFVPSEGPAFTEHDLYAFMRSLPLRANIGQDFLAANAERVRTGTLRQIATYGFIAAMPSLHIAHETIMLFYARPSRPFFAVSLAFTTATFAAVLVLGFHYALDAVAGFMLGALAVFVATRARVEWFPAFCNAPPDAPVEAPSETATAETTPTPAPAAAPSNKVARLASEPLSERGLAAFALVVSIAASIGFVRLLITDVALDIDPMNLVYGMRRFDIAQHAPHPPGYLAYILSLRGLHALRMAGPSLMERFDTTQWLALLFHAATIAATYAAVRRTRPNQPMLAGFAAMLTCLSPILVFHAIDAQTHCAEAFASALLLIMLVRYGERPSLGGAVGLGLLLALGAAFRPTFVVTAIGPIIFACRKRPKELVVAGFASVLGALAFLIPTFAMSGGFAAWKLANDALVRGIFVRNSSIMLGDQAHAMLASNFAATLSWLIVLLLPFGIGAATLAWLRRDEPKPVAHLEPDPFIAYALASVVPSAAFYFLVFCSEPGYLAGIVPFLIVAFVTRAKVDWDVRRASRGVLAVLIVQLLVLFGPTTPSLGVKQPTLRDVVAIDMRTTLWLQAIEGYGRGRPVLVVGDYAEVTLARQLPMIVPTAHMLSLYATPRSIFPRTMGGFITQDSWLPIPGPAQLVPGTPRIVNVPHSYDMVLIDALASDMLRSAIARTLTCPVTMLPHGRFVVIPAVCIADGVVALDGQGVRFRQPAR